MRARPDIQLVRVRMLDVGKLRVQPACGLSGEEAYAEVVLADAGRADRMRMADRIAT